MIKGVNCDQRAQKGMSLPDPPDLARTRTRLVLAAAVVALVVGVITGVRDAGLLAKTLGDTDDATRVYLFRSLLHGQGWWDQRLIRLQPPLGVFMHWSRLLDGGLAALNGLFALIAPPASAEWWTRMVWPLLWITPAALAALSLSDSLAEAARREDAPRPAAALVALVFLVTNFALYTQFRPGRVDHHDVQMTLCLAAAAGACAWRSPRGGALLAGAASALGLAVGLEALVFDAAIGAAFALRFILLPGQGPCLRRYGLSLAGVGLIAHLVQTPPDRWLVRACDALAANSLAALIVAGLALAAAAGLERRALAARAAAVAGAGIAAAIAYVGLDPQCLKGPFADVDPAIKGFWLVHVQEMRPWLVVLKQKPDDALIVATPAVMGLLAAAWLARRPLVRRHPAFLLCVSLLLMTSAVGFNGVRMAGYADWMATPILAAAGADAADVLSRRLRRDRLIVLAFAALLLTPELLTTGLMEARAGFAARQAPLKAKRPAPKEPADHCFETKAYGPLSLVKPAGLTLAEIDLGPFILTNTPHSALAAPYHRMSWGLIAAHTVLSGDADAPSTLTRARGLGVAYVLECRAHARRSDRDGMGQNALLRRLDQDRPPAWLERLSPPTAPLQIFRVRAPAGAPGAP